MNNVIRRYDAVVGWGVQSLLWVSIWADRGEWPWGIGLVFSILCLGLSLRRAQDSA